MLIIAEEHAMSRSYAVSMQDMGGGVNDYSRPDLIGMSETPNTARNIRGEAESFKPRKGYVEFADEIASTTVVALGTYNRFLESNDAMVMVTAEKKLYTIKPQTDTTWTEIPLGGLLNDVTTVDFSGYGDWLFIFNGADKPILVDDTTVTQPFTKPASIAAVADFKPAFGEVYNGSLFVAGVPSAPNVVFISKTASSATPEDIYDFSGALTGFGNADEMKFPDRITAIKQFSTSLVIFTTKEAYFVSGTVAIGATVTYDPQPIPGAGGAVTQDTVTVVENDLYYLTPQKEVRSLKKSLANSSSILTTAISTKIQRFIDDTMDNDLESSFSYYDEPNKLYKLYLREAGGVHNSYRIVADIEKVNDAGVPPFYIDDRMTFSTGIYFKTDGLQQSYIGSPVVGQVYADEMGLSDNGVSIPTARSTKVFNGGNPTTQKNYREVVIFGEKTDGTEITVTVYIDNIVVAVEVIDDNDFDNGASVLDAGIGTEGIGLFTIGSEGDDDITEDGLLKDFVKRITFRQKGKNIRVTFATNEINQNYRIRHMDYVYIPVSRNYNPIIEK